MKNKSYTFLLTFIICFLTVQMSVAQWVLQNSGMGNVWVSSLASSGNNIIAGTQTGIYVSTNLGLNWVQTNVTQDIRSLTANNNNVYAGSYSSGGVFKSTDNGVTWEQTSLNNLNIRSLASIGNNVYAGAWSPSAGVHISTDNGATWNASSLNVIVRSMVVHGDNIYVGSGGFTGVYLSNDNGATWDQTSLNNDYIGSLATDGSSIIAGSGTSDGLYISRNKGTNWTNYPLDNANVYALAITGNYFFAGTYNLGVYVSDNSGKSWTQRNDGLSVTGSQVYELCLFNNYIFAAVGIGGIMGVYRRPVGELTGITPISNVIPDKFSLSQNYPNPFNPYTKIKFSIPAAQFTILKVYDSQGKLAETLVSEQLNAGTYEAVWSAEKFSTGIYYYTLTTDEFSHTNKMILLK